MRWQLADHIDEFAPWSRIKGRKAVSLEEAYLLERFGVPGHEPETILVEAMAHFCRWLAVASSGFERSALLTDIIDLRVEERARMGDVVVVSAEAAAREDGILTCHASASVDGRVIANGRLSFALVPLAELTSPEDTRQIWREIYVEA